MANGIADIHLGGRGAAWVVLIIFFYSLKEYTKTNFYGDIGFALLSLFLISSGVNWFLRINGYRT